MQFNKRFVTDTLADVSIIRSYFPEDAQFSIDTRTLQKGEIFIALRGIQCDGHTFVHRALQMGAAGCIIAHDQQHILESIDTALLENKLIIAVKDTLKALVALAKAWRAQFSCPVIGITGTIGKTSTKECLANILDIHGSNYLASFGNQNTLVGVSLNLLRMRSLHEVVIIEMGISKRGEMAILTDVVRPTNAIITNIGHQHMDGLGSLLDIALEKRDIFKYFTEESIGIINGDQSILADVSYSHPVIKFGAKMTNQIQARKIRVSHTGIHFVLKMYGKKYNAALKNPHTGAVSNSLAAAAIARLLQVPDHIIVQAIQMLVVVAGRFEEMTIKKGKGVIINDCYNSNPESMKAALLAFEQLDTPAQKIAIIGDMLGLGVSSPFWHRQIGRFLRKVPSLQRVILVGSLVKWVKKTAPVGIAVEMVGTWQEAADCLENELKKEAMVLVKGSQDLGLSNLVEQFT